jgi:hypothetical protein
MVPDDEEGEYFVSDYGTLMLVFWRVTLDLFVEL